MFKQNFDSYACIGDFISCKVDGIEYRARIEHDIDYGIDDDDGHNPDQSVTGCDDKQQERLLNARQAWFNDEWFYCGVVISAHKAGVEIEQYAASLWGIDCNYPDSNNSYLKDVANELLPDAIDSANSILELLAA